MIGSAPGRKHGYPRRPSGQGPLSVTAGLAHVLRGATQNPTSRASPSEVVIANNASAHDVGATKPVSIARWLAHSIPALRSIERFVIESTCWYTYVRFADGFHAG